MLWFVLSWIILVNLHDFLFTSPIFVTNNILCFVTLWITRNVLTFMHIASRLLTAASACCILVGLEVSFVFLAFDCFVLCKLQNKRSQNTKTHLFSSGWKPTCIVLLTILIQLRILWNKVLNQKILYCTLPLWQ